MSSIFDESSNTGAWCGLTEGEQHYRIVLADDFAEVLQFKLAEHGLIELTKVIDMDIPTLRKFLTMGLTLLDDFDKRRSQLTPTPESKE